MQEPALPPPTPKHAKRRKGTKRTRGKIDIDYSALNEGHDPAYYTAHQPIDAHNAAVDPLSSMKVEALVAPCERAPGVPPAPLSMDEAALGPPAGAADQASGLTPLYRRFEQEVMGLNLALTSGA